MMIVLSIIIALVLIVLILGLIAPKDYQVERSVEINKSRDAVYNYVKYLKNQDAWSPWQQRDPNMKKSFEGTDGEAGFKSAWDGNKEVGSGEQIIQKIIENERIDSKLRFFKPWKSESDAYLKLSDAGDKTQVTWGFAGKNKFPVNIMMLFMNMDKTVGKDFDEGLTKLKSILES